MATAALGFRNFSMCRISPLVASPSLQAAHAMGPMTFGRRVVAALLLVTMASIGAAAEGETQRQTQQTRIDLVDVPRGLPDIGSAACNDARSFCAKTVLRALHEDENLTGFLDNVRKLAKEAGTPGSADGYAIAVIDPTSLKLPEMLALGCCLSAGACADDVTNSLPPDADADAVIDAAISARTAAAQILALAATHPDVAKMPAAAMLGADAAACSPPGDAKRCDDSIIDAFRRAGRAGHDMGSLRAAEVLISRYAGGLVERGCDWAGSEGEGEGTEAGDPADAAVARALLKNLLATNHDVAAGQRLKELQRVEEMRVKGGEHDAAYKAADAFVNLASKVLVFVAFVAAPLCLSRSARTWAWRWSGCGGFARRFRRELEWLRVVKPRVKNGGRQARRMEQRHGTKKWARDIIREAKRKGSRFVVVEDVDDEH